MYEVKSCVCDYAIYDEGKLIKDLIFNSRKNAELVCDVMNLDCNHKEYGRLKTVSIDIKNLDVMKKVVSKIIKNIEEKNGISKYNEELLSELVGKDFRSKIAFRFR